MSDKKNVHVVPNPNGGWDVKREGEKYPLGHRDTQQAAIETGRNSAKNNHAELVIHGRDGKIRDKDSYGHDPFPPRDSRR